MSGALLAFSATAVAVRALAPPFSAFEILAIRNGGGMVILLTLALVKPELRKQLYPLRFPVHLVRNLVHFGSTYGWTVGVTLLPLATVFALEFTAPVWVAILAVFFLRERLTVGRIVAVVLGFVGVLIILRPGLGTLDAASLLVLAAAFGFGLTAILTKSLTRTVGTYTILLWMNVIQLVPNLIGSSPAFWRKIETGQTLALAGICLGGLLSHLCLTNAYRWGDATMVVPLDFLRIPLIALVGWQFYGEPLDPFVFIGSLAIIGGILFNLRAEATVRTPA